MRSPGSPEVLWHLRLPVGHSLASAGRCGASTLLVTESGVVRASEKSAPAGNSTVYLEKRGRNSALVGNLISGGFGWVLRHGSGAACQQGRGGPRRGLRSVSGG